jgi:hypothetical protein
MIKNYGSDVIREQFEITREDLEKTKKTARARKLETYDVFGSIIHIENRMSVEKFTKRFHKLEKYLFLFNLSFSLFS